MDFPQPAGPPESGNMPPRLRHPIHHVTESRSSIVEHASAAQLADVHSELALQRAETHDLAAKVNSLTEITAKLEATLSKLGHVAPIGPPAMEGTAAHAPSPAPVDAPPGPESPPSPEQGLADKTFVYDEPPHNGLKLNKDLRFTKRERWPNTPSSTQDAEGEAAVSTTIKEMGTLGNLMPYYNQEKDRQKRATKVSLSPGHLLPPEAYGKTKLLQPHPPDPFYGVGDNVESFIHQITTMWSLAGQEDYPDDYKIRTTGLYLRGDALNWYDSINQSVTPSPYLENWDTFVLGLMDNFAADEPPLLAAANLLSLRQRNLTVTQYWVLFQHWAIRAGWDRIALNHVFQRGLQPWILDRFNSQGITPNTLDSSYRLANMMEKSQEAFEMMHPYYKSPRRQEDIKNKSTTNANKSANSSNNQPQTKENDSCPKSYGKYQPRPYGKNDFPPRSNDTVPKAPKKFNRMEEEHSSPPSETDTSEPLDDDVASPDDVDDLSPQEQVEAMYKAIGGYASFDPFEPVATYTIPEEPDSAAWREFLDHDNDISSESRNHLKLLFSLAKGAADVIYTPVLLPSAPRTKMKALVDTAASFNFIDPALCNHLGMTLVPSEDVPEISLGDGRKAPVTHYTLLTVLPGEGFEAYTAQFYVFPVGRPGLVLGAPFCKSHEPQFDWDNLRIYPKPDVRHSKSLRSMLASLPGPPRQPLREPDKGSEAVIGQVPPEFASFRDVFSEKLADQLPNHSRFDHEIVLLPDTVPRYGPLYKTSEPQSDFIRGYLKDNTLKKWIQVSKSSWASPVLFATKKDGSLRMCIDYRYVNSRTQKVRYPLPRIDQILERLYAAKYYSKIDLRNAYNLIRIKDGQEHITAFRTQYGLFEYRVMPFGLCNAPATFQRLMNYIFRDMIDVSVVVYLDDILIFSKDRQQHTAHIQEVLSRLRKFNLYAKDSKCEFYSHSVSFLGYYIDRDGISMDPSKVRSILDWPYPKRSRDILSFVGLANFYRNFIPGFAIATRILYDAARPTATFALTPDIIDAWDNLKRIMASNTVVRHFNPALPCIMETDASDYAIGAVLSQIENGITRPVAFISRKLQPAELNYPTHDKELLAIVYAFESWAHYLEGHQITIRVLSDHQSLKYFTEKKMLSRRQANWHDILSRFDFLICYTPGKTHIKADALSRRPDYLPEDTSSTSKSKELNPHNELTLLPPELFLNVMRQVAVSATSELKDLLQQASRTISLDFVGCHALTPKNGLLYHEDKIFVPQHLVDTVIDACHSPVSMGHPGIKKTIDNVAHDYWWPTLKVDTEKYVRHCEVCQRTKTATGKPNGLLRPLPVASRPWQHLSCDFVGPLPLSNGYNFVLTIVDRFTKMAIFVPCTKNITSLEFATLFVKYVYSRHGLPSTIVTDRGPQFTAKVWQCLASILGLNHRLSTAYHPQTDGQSEIVNKVLGQYLRVYTNLAQTDWTDKLPFAEFCYNSTPHSATGVPPIMALTGYEPRRSIDQIPDKPLPGVPVVPKVVKLAKSIKQLHANLTQALNDANSRYAEVYNRKRRDVRFKENDWVWLNTKNLRTLRPSKKLDDRYSGPYQIDKVINDLAYKLKMDNATSLGRTFHVDLLKPYCGVPPNPQVPPQSLSYGETQPLSIQAHRTVRNQKQWKILWSTQESSWESDDSMSKYPDWPGLRDTYNPSARPRKRKAKAPDDTPWKGWKWVSDTEHESSPLEDRTSTPGLDTTAALDSTEDHRRVTRSRAVRLNT